MTDHSSIYHKAKNQVLHKSAINFKTYLDIRFIGIMIVNIVKCTKITFLASRPNGFIEF